MREYSLREHKQIIDAYAALGYDLDTIAIAKGFYQPDAAEILRGYGFKLGSRWGDVLTISADSKKCRRRL